ncbi:uncharacterized protein LOC120474087 isoform X5 [Pimephales promelas]|uniref:uncharacterized protein LOC120474087 isoform X5 n=1 Tax=Pimephales promelas TaxID=90988 RepID=UPI0019557CEA|nr:uncharacterized protein LOC120474087 isoform X5 [Pimephales promelas]
MTIMGRKCIFSWCRSQSGLSMFPRDAARARLWLRAVGWPSTMDTSNLYVCRKHFTRESFENWRMVDFGLVDDQCKLRLASHAVPIPEDFSSPLEPSPSVGFAHVACQTDPPTAPSCGSPLSKKTHTPPFRSTGGAVSCPDAGVDTAAVSASGPSRKRPRLDEEELNEGPRDVTNAPLHSLTATQSTDVKTDPSSRPTRCPSTSCMRAVSWSCSRCA